MSDPSEHPSFLKRVLYFFPTQLLLLHLKRNHFIVLSWGILFAFVTGLIGTKYGIPYLFLAPEYLGEIDALSFAIMGFAYGGFIMAFNIYSYIMYGGKFRFIATVARPFYKFSLNNSIIPAVFTLVYIYKTSTFLSVNELQSNGLIALEMLSFLGGCLLFLILSYLYFFTTNTDLKKLNKEQEPEAFESPIHNKKPWYKAFFQEQEWHVRSYIASWNDINLARDVSHYSNDLLKQVLAQNSINATRFEILSVASFIILGTFKEYELIRIPAGASILLLFTIILMLISVMFTWFKGWTTTIIIASIALINLATNQYDFMRFKNHAYGLNYEVKAANYSTYNFKPDMDRMQNDIAAEILALDKWKKHTELDKPKLIIVNCSGGGLRSSLWTFHTLQKIDKSSDGAFMKQTKLITGSSGGMIGAAYFRSLMLQDLSSSEKDRFNPNHKHKLSQDLLNSISFTIATSDLFPRIQSFEYNGMSYTKDRAFMFENNLNQNTNELFNKPLSYFDDYVLNGLIPRMILAPTVVNDGRRLLISSDHLSYMCHSRSEDSQIENIELRDLFESQGADDLRYSSALRMNATFPYVFPMVSLPSSPEIEVMDAGLRDNYGVKDAVQYLSVFKDWIKENTSGVVIIQIRDRTKAFSSEHHNSGSLLRRVFAPFSNVYGNVFKTQDYSNDQIMNEFLSHFDHPSEIVHFDLLKHEDQDISMSWHLTALEKRRIIESLTSNGNLESLKRIQQIIENN